MHQWTEQSSVLCLVCRRFTRIAQEIYKVRFHLSISEFLWFVEDESLSLLTYKLHFVYADSQFAVGVSGLLPCRVEFVRLWMCKILTFHDCCISCISFQIHTPTKDASLGKMFTLWYDKFDYSCLKKWSQYEYCMYVIQSSSLQLHAGYKPSELKECVQIIHDLQLSKRGSAWVAVREKYRQHKVCVIFNILFLWKQWQYAIMCNLIQLNFFEQFKCVATLTSPPVIPVSYFEDTKEWQLWCAAVIRLVMNQWDIQLL